MIPTFYNFTTSNHFYKPLLKILGAVYKARYWVVNLQLCNIPM